MEMQVIDRLASVFAVVDHNAVSISNVQSLGTILNSLLKVFSPKNLPLAVSNNFPKSASSKMPDERNVKNE
jgi:hypothetical protein